MTIRDRTSIKRDAGRAKDGEAEPVAVFETRGAKFGPQVKAATLLPAAYVFEIGNVALRA